MMGTRSRICNACAEMKPAGIECRMDLMPAAWRKSRCRAFSFSPILCGLNRYYFFKCNIPL